uniref:Uncharacterized protein n=1 Tax=Amazona collaria TaxID=241587 RepID=A0A8B9F7P7_9PSIT
FSRLCLHFYCFCANCFPHLYYGPFVLPQSTMLMLSQVYRRHLGLADPIHLVLPFQPNAFPYPKKEEAAFGKHISFVSYQKCSHLGPGKKIKKKSFC